MPSTHPDLEIIKFIANIEGEEPREVQVLDEHLHIKIPEHSKYSMTIYFKVHNRALDNVKYTQIIKKAGIVVKQRDLELGPHFEPSEETYSTTFPEDTTPGGWIMRAKYPAQSIYYAGDEELMTVDWTLEITSK